MFRNTRVPIRTVFDFLEAGDTLEDFLRAFPSVTRAQAIGAMKEAKEALLAEPDAAASGNACAAGAAYIDGELVPIGEARIPITDWGFTRSDVTYDVVHVWKGSFFRLEDHLDRFERGCRELRLDPARSRAEIVEILMRCVRRTGLRDAYVEMLCTRGVPPPGSRDPRECENRFAAFAVPFVWIMSPEKQDAGGHLHISPIPRIAPTSVNPTVKNFHWADLTRGLLQGLDRGADTAVLCDPEGNVSEGPGFNVFRVANGRVSTPEGTVLEGITRRTVMELCQELGIACELGPISPEALRDADEVFISSTAGGIMPIVKVDDRILSNGAPGPVTRRLRELYWVKHEEGWHATPVDYRDPPGRRE